MMRSGRCKRLVRVHKKRVLEFRLKEKSKSPLTKIPDDGCCLGGENKSPNIKKKGERDLPRFI